MNTIKRHARALVALGFVAAAVATPILFGACTPGDQITASESDVVITAYDNQFNFGVLNTFTVLDTIVELGDSTKGGDQIDHSDDQEILGWIQQGFEKAGYTWVDPSTVDSLNVPDFIIQVGVTTQDFYSVYSYWPGYPAYGWCWYCWGGWYPYYPSTGVSYAYTTGTLITVMTNPHKDPDQANQVVSSPWQGAINGVINDSGSSITSRLQSSINQMFAQSPYLKRVQ